MRLLERMGYRNVAHYAGGIRGWRVANLRFDTGRERSVRPEERVGSSSGGRSDQPAPAI